MKKLMFVVAMTSAFAAVAADVAKTEKTDAKPAEVATEESPLFWGFANYGVYSGYQLYGSLVNCEPTLQGYVEGNFNLSIADLDLGYLGVGVWSNSDLTKRRNDYYLGNMFNEWDFNVHWARTFWFDDDKVWGLTYRTSVVWYYYPHENYNNNRISNKTTIDWNHYFELTNPYLVPYVNVVKEYKRTMANLVQFGVKKPFQITDEFSLCPFIEMVWRESRYNWCFPTGFGALETNSGLATLKLELDGTYMFTENFGIFAKIAFCSVIDRDLRNNIDQLAPNAYGGTKDYVWGGIGITCSF